MKRAIALLCTIILAGCATTALQKPQRDPDFQGTAIKRVLVVSLSQIPERRQAIEDEFVRQWQLRGVTAVASYFVLEKDTPLDKMHVAPIAKAQGFDTVLVSRLVGRGNIDPRLPAWDSESNISSSDRALSKDYPVLVASPGYSPTYEQAVVITSLYGVISQKKLWSATSQTLITESLQKLIQTYVKEILKAIYQ